MRLEARKYLFDMQQACARIVEFTDELTFADYQQDPMVRSAVERQFEIIGEALNQLLKIDPALGPRITDAAKIIAFRNILIHAYTNVSDAVVWGTIETDLPRLRGEIDDLLASD